MNKNTKNPFKTPEGYFDSFPDRFMDKLANHESELPKKQGFKTPDDYFNNFQVTITEDVVPKEVKIIKLKPLKQGIAIAASIAAITIMLLGFNWDFNKPVSFNELANIDIEAYFDHNELDLSTYDIAEVIPLEGMEIADIIDHHIKDEHIEDYLNENISDFETLNVQDNE